MPTEKNGHTNASGGWQYQRMSGAEKAEVLTKVTSSGLPKGKVLGELGVPSSTHYRSLRRKEQQQGLEDHAGGGRPPWNRLTSQEVHRILWAAREMPELSPRQLAARTTGNQGFSVSESTGISGPAQGGAGEEA